MKKYIIIAVLVLAAAGGGAWFFLFSESPEDETAHFEKATVSELIYAKVGQIAVPVFRDGALHAQLIADFQLEVTSDQAQTEVYRRAAELRDAYLSELYDMADRVARGHEVIDLDRLKLRLEAITTRVLGPGLVRAILIQNVIIHQV